LGEGLKDHLFTKRYVGPRTSIQLNDLGNGKWIWDLDHRMLGVCTEQVNYNSSMRIGEVVSSGSTGGQMG